jgi:hypothetical protein
MSSERQKNENGTRRPRYRPKRVQERKTWKQDPPPLFRPQMNPREENMKTGLDAVSTSLNESGSAKHENMTQRPRFRQKWL